MKNIKDLAVLTLSILALSPLAPAEGGKGEGQPDQKERLTKEERQQLRSAHAKARENAQVTAAKERFDAARTAAQEARKTAVLSVDPTLAPVLEKVEGEKGRRAWKNLTEEEREQLKAANKEVQQSGVLNPTRLQMHEAAKALQTAMKAALLIADPAIAPILEKIGNRGLGKKRGGGHWKKEGKSPTTGAKAEPGA